jgi:hypothetical protein
MVSAFLGDLDPPRTLEQRENSLCFSGMGKGKPCSKIVAAHEKLAHRTDVILK